MAHHAAGLVRLTKNPGLAQSLELDHTAADVSVRQRAILNYAVKLTETPWAMERSDVDRLRAQGLDDRGVLDVNQVVAYFAYVNRVADGLGVAIDDYALTEHATITRHEAPATSATTMSVEPEKPIQPS